MAIKRMTVETERKRRKIDKELLKELFLEARMILERP